MRWILATLFCVVIIVFLVVLLVGAASNGYSFLGALKAIDVATISLAAASLAVTSVGIVVAVVGAFGYSQIKESAISASIAEARLVAGIKATEVATTKATEVASAVAARTVTDYLAQQANVGGVAASEELVQAVVKEENGE